MATIHRPLISPVLFVLEIAIAGQAVEAEAALVAGDGRGHAQGGVAVVVVGANAAAHQLAEGVELFGEQLSCRDDGEGIPAVLLLDALDGFRRTIKCLVPTGLAPFILPARANHRIRAAPGRREQLVLLQPLDAQLAAIHIGSGMTAAGNHLACGIKAKFDGTAGRTVVAGGVLPGSHGLGRNDDGFSVGASEQHRASLPLWISHGLLQ